MFELNKIVYCPLDLPSIPTEIGLGNLDQFDLMIGSDEYVAKDTWKAVRLFNPAEGCYTDFAMQKTPKLIKWIEENLPFQEFSNLLLISSTKKVKSHIDWSVQAKENKLASHKLLEPYFYRLHIDGPMIDQGFFLESDLIGGKRYAQLPKNSPGWVMNGCTIPHGNDDDSATSKLLCFVHGTLDAKKHFDLVRKSFERHKEYAICLK